jgi:hypothetical protein
MSDSDVVIVAIEMAFELLLLVLFAVVPVIVDVGEREPIGRLMLGA